MGANASQLEKDIGSDLFPPNEHYFGLVSLMAPTFYLLIDIKLFSNSKGQFRQHMLLQLCPPGALLLQAIPR